MTSSVGFDPRLPDLRNLRDVGGLRSGDVVAVMLAPLRTLDAYRARLDALPEESRTAEPRTWSA